MKTTKALRLPKAVVGALLWLIPFNADAASVDVRQPASIDKKLHVAGATHDKKVISLNTAKSDTPDAPTILVALPKKQKVDEYVELTGNAQSPNHVDLVARVEGYLQQVHFKDGQIVKKGDLLFS